ncbi:hypothetical protein K492DRAFT_64757 [Lichtheimia hyalospora FSU 10163]|nr:hypothetical protein K492DRAFT_64757 [Lichtheimia hyalospora FSU 10163]
MKLNPPSQKCQVPLWIATYASPPYLISSYYYSLPMPYKCKGRRIAFYNSSPSLLTLSFLPIPLF